MGGNEKKMENSFSALLSGKSTPEAAPGPRKQSRRYSIILPEEYNAFFCSYQSNKMRQSGEKCTDVQVVLDALDALREKLNNQ